MSAAETSSRTDEQPTVMAGDIARLAGVGRAAVSNWRRRFDDFPEPVGGTSASPAFRLGEVTDWLDRHGKAFQLSDVDVFWQRLRASVDDLRLGEAVGDIGAALILRDRDPAAWRALARRTDADLADRLPAEFARVVPELPGETATGTDATLAGVLRSLPELLGTAAATYELLCARYREAHSRRLLLTPEPVVEVLVGLVDVGGRTVLDPACRVGSVLLAAANAGAGAVLGQEADTASARVAAARLVLAGQHCTVAAGDALRADGFDGVEADVVLCNPPFNDRTWGYDELSADTRWEHGVPPRGEPELAWVQHCLARVRPGGTVAIVMPVAAASRRAGRRIRNSLLRSGALRAVLAMPVTDPASPPAPHVWVLRRPEPDTEAASDVLMVADAASPADAADAWRRYADGQPAAEVAEGVEVVRIIDLLDEDVDLSPRRHTVASTVDAATYVRLRERLRSACEAVRADIPDLTDTTHDPEPAQSTLAELVKTGLVGLLQAPLRMPAEAAEPSGVDDVAVLTLKDLRLGRAATGSGPASPEMVRIQAGDVVVPRDLAGATRVRVVDDDTDWVLGARLLLLRCDPERVDPYYLAGALRAGFERGAARPGSVSSRLDPRRIPVARVSIEHQRRLGRSFRRLFDLESQLDEIAAAGERLVATAVDGLATGVLGPDDRGNQ